MQCIASEIVNTTMSAVAETDECSHNRPRAGKPSSPEEVKSLQDFAVDEFLKVDFGNVTQQAVGDADTASLVPEEMLVAAFASRRRNQKKASEDGKDPVDCLSLHGLNGKARNLARCRRTTAARVLTRHVIVRLQEEILRLRQDMNSESGALASTQKGTARALGKCPQSCCAAVTKCVGRDKSGNPISVYKKGDYEFRRTKQ